MRLGTVAYAFISAAIAWAALLGPAKAADIDGSQDPLVGRYEGSDIVAYKVTEFDEVSIIESPFDYTKMPGGEGFKTIQGKSFLIYYTLRQGRSTLEVLRNYEDSLKANGFSVIFTCSTANGSCFSTGQPEAAFKPSAIRTTSPRWSTTMCITGSLRGRYLLGKLDRQRRSIQPRNTSPWAIKNSA